MTIEVRAARPGEAAAVADLINVINTLDGGAPAVPMTAEVVRRDLLGPAPRAVLRVGVLDGAVVGFATGGTVYDAARCADILMLLDLYVAPVARRRGVGRALMAGLVAEARRRGVACLWWGVDDGDDAAVQFYGAIGAVPEDHFTGFILERGALDALAGGV